MGNRASLFVDGGLSPQLTAVSRLDSALMNWPVPVGKLRGLGYDVEEELSDKTFRFGGGKLLD